MEMVTLTEPGNPLAFLIIGIYFIIFGLLIVFGNKKYFKKQEEVEKNSEI
jgi:hypothetical protein